MKDNITYYHQYSDELDEPEVILMVDKYGVEGYGRYIIIKHMLREEEGFRINISKPTVWILFAKRLNCNPDEAETYIKDCIEVDLFQSDGTYLSCRLFFEKGVKKLIEERIKKSKAGKKGMGSRWGGG